MSDKKSIYKPRPISGFPEWLPEVRLVEQQWFDHIRRVFESYGFCSIETPSVEEIGVLEAKGEVDKEIYVIERLHKEDGDKEARLALHFDQTVPLARYVAQNFNELVFPFKRYQMQKVWRGERPQAGRFREFYQCDIDVINIDALPLHFDAEMPAIMWEILAALPGMKNEKIQMRISNRKILMGLLGEFAPEKTLSVTRVIDKVEKIGIDRTEAELKNLDLSSSEIQAIKDLIAIKTSDPNDLMKRVTSLSQKYQNNLLLAGTQELFFILENLKHLPPNSCIADLSIVRGLDYYTGIVYETVFLDDPGYGSICSGGRYEDLASGYINKKLPGVGISIGFSRLFERMRLQNKLPVNAKSPADILMVLPSEERRPQTANAAQALRRRGLKVELYHAPKKIPDQMKYASRKGIPFVWFPPFDDAGKHEVKDMTTGQQAEANPDKWEKP